MTSTLPPDSRETKRQPTIPFEKNSYNTAEMPLTGADVATHNNKDSCWVIVHGKAYDVTEFLPGTPIARDTPSQSILEVHCRE